MSPHSMLGRTALITGGASGIGRATAYHFASLGATVAIGDVDEEKTADAIRELGTPHRSVHLDVSDSHSWASALAELATAGLHCDLFHLNAGIITRPKGQSSDDDVLEWVTENNYRRVMSVNADGPILGVIATLPYLRAAGGGDIVITSSAGGVIPMIFDPLYAMSKIGALALVWSLAPTLTPLAIRLNAICPKIVDTDMLGPNERERLSTRGIDPPEMIAANVAAIIETGETGGAWVPDPAAANGIRRYTPTPMFG